MPSAPSKNSAAVQKVVIALGSLAVIAGAYYASSMKAQVPMIDRDAPCSGGAGR